MKLFLAATLINKDLTLKNPFYKKNILLSDLYILESYHYILNNNGYFLYLKNLKDFY